MFQKKQQWLLVLASLLISSCSPTESWNGIVYPDKNDLSSSIKLGAFENLNECGVRSLIVLDRLGSLRRGDYECGKNCTPEKTTPSSLVCEETTKANIAVTSIPYNRGSFQSAVEANCISRVHKHYKSEYLTYPGMMKAWYIKKTGAIGIKPSENQGQYIKGYNYFNEAVNCLASSSDGVVPTLSMGPTEFEVYFDGLAESKKLHYRLGK